LTLAMCGGAGEFAPLLGPQPAAPRATSAATAISCGLMRIPP
jgi:hypothetical protein